MIKRKTTYYLFSMALVACLTAFSACSADETAVEETAPVNPTFDGRKVKTQFAISIPRAGTNKRMTSENTQNDNGFLGMDQIHLIAMQSPEGGITASSPISERFMLEGFTPNDEDLTDEQSGKRKIYRDLGITVGTSHFLFYGQAPDADGTDGTDEIARHFARGVLQNNLTGNPAVSITTPDDIRFSLQPIAPQTSGNAILLQQLNAVIQTPRWKETAQSGSTTPGAADDEDVLYTLYQNLTTLTAGSARAIQTTLEDLYNALVPLSSSIAEAIQAQMTNEDGLFVAEDENGDNTYVLNFKEGIAPETKEFPTRAGLPEGAVKLYFSDADGTPTFSYEPKSYIGSEDNHVDVSSITYPARLTYYAATPVKATNQADPASWGWDNGWDSSWSDVVTASTRTIALEEKINYGVAALQTTVRFGRQSLKDARPEAHYITIGEDEFRVTGLLVGGQPKELQYDMTPAAGTTFTQTIYDWDIPEGGLYVTYNSYTAPNYTLVADNQGAINPAVNFAIEIENGSTSTIYGVNGIIKPGMRFYLVGQLDPSGTAGITKPEGVDHVFVQDHTTQARVTIQSFEQAYVTIPDLRSTQLQLGLYVDLQWQQGYTEDVTIPLTVGKEW